VARGLGVETVARLSAWATGGLEPDLVIVFDVDPATAGGRRAGPQDRMEREPDSFRASVLAAYRELAARYGWTVLDGSASVDAVAEQVWAAVERVLA
jgi:dTMP kinase